MAGILDSLPRSAKAAYPAIERGVREGLSAERIQSALQANGMGIRRQRLLDIMRLVKGVTDYGKVLRSMDREAPIATDALPEAITRTRRGFSYTVELRGAGVMGSSTVQHVTVSTDNPALSPQDILDAARELGVRGQDRYGLSVEQATIVSGIRAGASGTFQDDEGQ